MKLKLLALFAIGLQHQAEAQFLKKLKKKVEQSVEKSIEKKVGEKVEKETDTAFDETIGQVGFKSGPGGSGAAPKGVYSFDHEYVIKQTDLINGAEPMVYNVFVYDFVACFSN